jgi:hypothetical protein
MGGLIPLNGISFFGSDSVEFYSFREELRDHPGICGEKTGRFRVVLNSPE